jgi:hypothetical protein
LGILGGTDLRIELGGMRKYTSLTANDALFDLVRHAEKIFSIMETGRNTDRAAKLAFGEMWESVLSAFKHGSVKQSHDVASLSVLHEAAGASVDRKVTFAANYLVGNVSRVIKPIVPESDRTESSSDTSPPQQLTNSQRESADAVRFQAAVAPDGWINHSFLDAKTWSNGATDECIPIFGNKRYVAGVQSVFRQMTCKSDVPNQTYSPDGGLLYCGHPLTIDEYKLDESGDCFDGAKVAMVKPLNLRPTAYLLATDCHGATFYQTSAKVDTADYSKNSIEICHLQKIAIGFGKGPNTLKNYVNSVKKITTVMHNIVHEILDGFDGLEKAMETCIKRLEWSMGIQRGATKTPLTGHPELYALNNKDLVKLPKPDSSLSVNPFGVECFTMAYPNLPVPGTGGITGTENKQNPAFAQFMDLNKTEFDAEQNLLIRQTFLREKAKRLERGRKSKQTDSKQNQSKQTVVLPPKKAQKRKAPACPVGKQPNTAKRPRESDSENVYGEVNVGNESQSESQLPQKARSPKRVQKKKVQVNDGASTSNAPQSETESESQSQSLLPQKAPSPQKKNDGASTSAATRSLVSRVRKKWYRGTSNKSSAERALSAEKGQETKRRNREKEIEERENAIEAKDRAKAKKNEDKRK